MGPPGPPSLFQGLRAAELIPRSILYPILLPNVSRVLLGPGAKTGQHAQSHSGLALEPGAMTSLIFKIQQGRGGRQGVMETVPHGRVVQGVQVRLVGDQGPIVGFVACAYMASQAGLKFLPTCQGAKRKQDQRPSEG